MSYFNRIGNLWNFILKIAPLDNFLTITSFKTFLYKTYKELLTEIFDPDLPCTYSCAGRVRVIINSFSTI